MSKPKGARTGDRIGKLADEVPGEVVELLDLADDAISAVLHDPAVWAEERGRQDAALLPWPLAMDGVTNDQVMVHWFAEQAVENVLDAIARSHGLPDGSIAPPPDTTDPEFQAILRVCKRATDAADATLRASKFRGAGRLGGRRALYNWMKRKAVGHLIEQGLSVTEASAKVGLGKSSAYRSLGRRTQRP